MGQGVAYALGFIVFAFFPFTIGLAEVNGFLFLATLLIFMLAFASQKAIAMAAVLILNLVLRLIIGDPNLPLYALSFAVGLYCYAAVVHLLCPRCRTGLGISWSGWSGIGHRPWCPACGRTHDGVRPFQHLHKPEAWDGEYHDEGGGEQTDSARLWTERACTRWLKRQRSRR